MTQRPYYLDFDPAEEKRLTEIFERHGISTAFITRYPEGKVTGAKAETSINLWLEPEDAALLLAIDGIKPIPGQRLGRTCWSTPISPKAG